MAEKALRAVRAFVPMQLRAFQTVAEIQVKCCQARDHDPGLAADSLARWDIGAAVARGAAVGVSTGTLRRGGLRDLVCRNHACLRFTYLFYSRITDSMKHRCTLIGTTLHGRGVCRWAALQRCLWRCRRRWRRRGCSACAWRFPSPTLAATTSLSRYDACGINRPFSTMHD